MTMPFVKDGSFHRMVPLALPVPRLILSALMMVGPAPRLRVQVRPLLLADSPRLKVFAATVLVPSARVSVTVSALPPLPPTLKLPEMLFTLKLPAPEIVTSVVEWATPSENGPLTGNDGRRRQFQGEQHFGQLQRR